MKILADSCAKSRLGLIPSAARSTNDELMNGVTAVFKHCCNVQKDSSNPGFASWTFPLIRMLSHHLANCTKLPFILMSDDAEHDTSIGQPLRDANSKFIWINDPDDPGERVKIIVESRDKVVQLLEEHLNRNGGTFRMVPDLGEPVAEAAAPAARGGRRRSFD